MVRSTPKRSTAIDLVARLFPGSSETAAKLVLRLVDFDLIVARKEELRRWQVFDVAVTKVELETASMSWQAYRAPTPEACFDLLSKNLSALPLLRPALVDLLAELPSGVTGLGATEMRLLEMLVREHECAVDQRPSVAVGPGSDRALTKGVIVSLIQMGGE